MTHTLARPSFWTEPRDPGAWQRALLRVDELGPIEDPWPAWEHSLRGTLSRRAVAGLYGLKPSPQPGAWLGAGLLALTHDGWSVHPDARPLLTLDRDGFQAGLSHWLVQRSPWVRLALVRLGSGAWQMPQGTAPLHSGRAMRIGEDLHVGTRQLCELLPASLTGVAEPLRVNLDARALAPLHGPLYLLHAQGWIDASGRPTLPSELHRTLLPAPPADILRRISAEEADGRGFVALEQMSRRLWGALHPQATPHELAAWTDRVLGQAIERGTIEVHDWAPGQPRHGRGLYGDRDRKLVRWTIHDDFDLRGGSA